MLCLSCLLPGKAGKLVRKIAIPITGIILIYAICWGMILKGVKFATNDVSLMDQSLMINFDVRNTSFGNIDLIDIDFYNKNNKKVMKETKDLPLFIESYSSAPLRIILPLEELESVRLTVKILGLQKDFKTKLNKNK